MATLGGRYKPTMALQSASTGLRNGRASGGSEVRHKGPREYGPATRRPRVESSATNRRRRQRGATGPVRQCQHPQPPNGIPGVTDDRPLMHRFRHQVSITAVRVDDFGLDKTPAHTGPADRKLWTADYWPQGMGGRYKPNMALQSALRALW